jgi:integrase
MARQIERLSSAKVKHAKPGKHPDGGGLYLQVTVGKDGQTNKSWLYRFELGGRERWMGLGSLNTIGLAESREAAKECRKLTREGRDPVELRHAGRASQRVVKAKSMTFAQCAVAYMASHESGWRNAKHRQAWYNTLRDYATPVIGNLPVQSVDTGLVLQVLQPIWNSRTETASRLRGRIESVLDWAKVSGHRAGENPARWRGHLDHLLPKPTKIKKVEHHEALPYRDLPGLLVALRAREGVEARALEFLILTAARSGEVLGAAWNEIDTAAKVWTVPADRMKAGIEQRVPLSLAAVAVIETMRERRQNNWLFPGHREGRPLGPVALLLVVRRLAPVGTTVHGFRSSFRDWCAERTNYANHVVEAALAHAVSNKVEAAYRRSDLFEQRARLMDDWARFCCLPVAVTDNVVPMQAAGR